MSDMLQFVVEMRNSQCATLRVISLLECCQSRRQAEACRTGGGALWYWFTLKFQYWKVIPKGCNSIAVGERSDTHGLFNLISPTLKGVAFMQMTLSGSGAFSLPHSVGRCAH